jgi:hypothetical protein
MVKQFITIRQTKTIGDCAVGAICRSGSECFVPCDITFWVDLNNKPIGMPIPLIREHLKSFLKHRGFPGINLLQAPIFTVIKDKSTGQDRILGHRIPSVRFPSWMRCLKCGLLHHLPWLKFEAEQGKKVDSVEDLRCSSLGCGGKLEFETWVLISSEGYLDDIPWGFLAHRNENRSCNSKSHLYLRRNHKGLLELQCRLCSSPAVDMNGLRNKEFFTGLYKMRKQPWLKEYSIVQQELRELPIAVKITDVRVHMPDIVGALDIPPESRIDENDVRARIVQLDDWNFIKPYQRIDRNKYRRLIKSTALLLGVDRGAINSALDDLENGWPTADLSAPENGVTSVDEMIAAEYNALCTCYDDFSEHERFITEHQTVNWKALIKSGDMALHQKKILATVDKLIVVKRLREIQAFCGFFRKAKGGISTPPGLNGSTTWLPACELYGEGIFFSLDEKKLHEWEVLSCCKECAELIAKRLEKSIFRMGLPAPTPRFILLHTIAHILIKQLEFSAGYPISSIKEKIYCSDDTSFPMSGILIYLVVPNKMGSLGGLSEHGKPENFLKLWLKAIEKAEYCSYDPICSEHEGQGPDQLNRAACHGCALLPEISCAYNNCLLDRKFITGHQNSGIIGFMHHVQN